VLRRRIAQALDRRFGALDERVVALTESVDRLERQLRWVVQGHQHNRARLEAARAEPAYAAVYEQAEPLISVVIPTFDKTDLLLERSLPSVLGQTYERLEVIVVGHAVADDSVARVTAVGDARVRFTNLGYRVAHPHPTWMWLAGSVPARVHGQALARGSWLVDFDDDDALRPDAIERGLACALGGGHEVTCGRWIYHWADREAELIDTFPPEYGRYAAQGALMHRALRFFERQQAAADYGVANDWFRCEAMLRAGVRFGRHADVVFDYYPSLRASEGGV
jgi:glycosyltransferase involved in cell wall biosynthesis